MRSAVSLPCFFVVVKSQRVVGGCTDRIPFILWDFVPYWGCCPKNLLAQDLQHTLWSQKFPKWAKLDYSRPKLLSLMPTLALRPCWLAFRPLQLALSPLQVSLRPWGPARGVWGPAGGVGGLAGVGGQTGGPMDGQTDGRMDGISPNLQEFVPCQRGCPATLWNRAGFWCLLAFYCRVSDWPTLGKNRVTLSHNS